MKSSLMLLVLMGLTVRIVPAEAAELNGVKMAESMQVGDKTLVLNGMGTRIVRKIGIPFKVYVGGLYLEKKTQDPKEIIEGSQIRKIVMEFKRSVSDKQIRETWKEGFEANCYADCDQAKKALEEEFNAQMIPLKEGQIMSVTVFADKVELELPGKPLVTIPGTPLAKNLLAVYFGKKPTNPELYSGLLGK